MEYKLTTPHQKRRWHRCGRGHGGAFPAWCTPPGIRPQTMMELLDEGKPLPFPVEGAAVL